MCKPNNCHGKAPFEADVSSLDMLPSLGSDGCKTSKLHGNVTLTLTMFEEMVKCTKKS